MVGGFAAEAVAWGALSSGRRNVWLVMTPVLAAMGVAAVVVGRPPASPEVAPEVAALVGLLVGIVLYLATRAFVIAVGGWTAFERHAVRMYARQGSLPLASALLLSAMLMVPGEELFWRGLFQVELTAAVDGGAALAATVTWVAFVLANLPSANLAIVAGATVGGAVWAGLGWWTGGFLAALVSHLAWTALMLSLPVVRVREGTSS
ncbi:MAG TPA: CPBP family intramembrane glutamic endopeptidase [Actinomycetota bacterium]|nr:CPBP family intramembrane glutamic endopeptidase [Actinomycetota bacterium]